MPNPYEPAPRIQHVHMVRDGDSVEVHFTNPEWRQGILTLTCKNGILSMKYSDSDGEFGSQVVRLATD